MAKELQPVAKELQLQPRVLDVLWYVKYVLLQQERTQTVVDVSIFHT